VRGCLTFGHLPPWVKALLAVPASAPFLLCEPRGCLGKEGERSYVCSSSLADRLGAAGAGATGASRDRPAPGAAGRLIDVRGRIVAGRLRWRAGGADRS